jgi:hypothetical protein
MDMDDDEIIEFLNTLFFWFDNQARLFLFNVAEKPASRS